MKRYTVGVDFGSLSARAVLMDLDTGAAVGSAVYDAPHGVLTERLPDGTPLGPDWAVQDPEDYWNTFPALIPPLLEQCGVTAEEVAEAYERNTGLVIAETFRDRDPEAVPGGLVCKHGPFTWGGSCRKAVENALILEETAHMALLTEQLQPDVAPAPQYLQDKHYFRKHGANAYYGQK